MPVAARFFFASNASIISFRFGLALTSSRHLPQYSARNDAVLQRDMPVPVWGWADKGERVTVILGNQSKTAIADDDHRTCVEVFGDGLEDELGDVLGERGLAGSGIAEQAKDRRRAVPAGLGPQPVSNGLQRGILMRRKGCHEVPVGRAARGDDSNEPQN